MWQKIRAYLDEKLVRPFRESHAPVKELALGSAVGMFWALTPLVGIQMYLVTMNWLLFKFIKQKFNLAVALAMVWISNPITMGPLYYAFYKTGFHTFDLLGLNPLVITFENFQAVLTKAMQQKLLDGLITWGEFLLNDLGWPTLIGGYIIAIPFAIASYPVTKRMVNNHRTRLAAKEGLTLEQWEQKHIHTFREILAIEKAEHEQEAELLATANATATPGKKKSSKKSSARSGGSNSRTGSAVAKKSAGTTRSSKKSKPSASKTKPSKNASGAGNSRKKRSA